MSLDILDLIILSIIIIHFITQRVNSLAIIWGLILSFYFFFERNTGFLFPLFVGLSGTTLTWLFFDFANYFKDSLVFRLLILYISTKLMLSLPLEIASYLLSKIT